MELHPASQYISRSKSPHESLQIRTAFILRHDSPNVLGCSGSFYLCIGNRSSPYRHHCLYVPAARLHSSVPDPDNDCARFGIAFEHPNRRTLRVQRYLDVY